MRVVGGHPQQRDVLAALEVPSQVGHRVLDGDARVPARAVAAVEEVGTEGRHDQRDEHREGGGHPADGARTRAYGTRAHAEPGRVLERGVGAESPSPARHLLVLLDEQHQHEAARGEHEDPPGDAVAEQAHRDAVDGEQGQPGEGYPPQGAGEQVDEQQAGQAADDQQGMDARGVHGDRRGVAVGRGDGVGERLVHPLPGRTDRHRRAAQHHAREPPGRDHLGSNHRGSGQPPPAGEGADAGHDDRKHQQGTEEPARPLRETPPREQGHPGRAGRGGGQGGEGGQPAAHAAHPGTTSVVGTWVPGA